MAPHAKYLGLGFWPSSELGAWDLEFRALLRTLFPRIGFRDNQADGVLIEAFEAAFALKILQ